MRFAYYAHKSTVPALIIAGCALYILDQLSKWMAIRSIPAGESITVIPNFFSLVQVHNTGAAFGILPGNNVVFVILSILA
ncbi:MAG: signal peptidase II [Verrucomicrobia bacterium]|nr:signal peptidase II [Verrucomicrobiota bacterium]